MNEPSKEVLERQKLAQDIRFERIKLYLSIVGVVLVLSGLIADRLKTHQQQRHEFELAQFGQKLNRMRVIVEEYDRLVAQTLAVLDKNRSRTWLLVTEMEQLEQTLRDLKSKDQDLLRARQYVHDLNARLAKSTVSVDEWADALSLEAKWGTSSHSPTPDFEYYFGAELLRPWSGVREAAIDAIRAEYSLFGKEPNAKKDRFRQTATELQAQLYARMLETGKSQ